MRKLVLVLLILTFRTDLALGGEINGQKLRGTVAWPKIGWFFTVKFDPFEGYYVGGDGADLDSRQASLLGSMRGDSSDADRYYTLARLHYRYREDSQYKEEAEKAVTLYRDRLREHPADATALAQFARCSFQFGDREEGARLVRKALEKLPDEWVLWSVFAIILDTQAIQALHKEEKWSELLQASVERLASGKAGATEVKRYQQLRDEAVAAHDKAIALAPAQGLLYAERAFSRYMHELLDAAAQRGRGEAVHGDPPGVCRASLSDWQKAAELLPDNPLAIFLPAFQEVGLTLRKNGNQVCERPADCLPEQTMKSVRKASAQLEKLSASTDFAIAGAAAEVLGALRILVFKDKKNAEASFCRAIALAPYRHQAWGGLMVVWSLDDQWDAIVTLCREHLRSNDSARSQIDLTHAYVRTGQDEKAVSILRKLLKREPDALWLNLYFFSLLVRDANDDAALREARKQLEKTAPLLKNAPAEMRNIFAVNEAILMALSGDVLSAQLRLQKLLEADHNNADAKKAVEALRD